MNISDSKFHISYRYLYSCSKEIGKCDKLSANKSKFGNILHIDNRLPSKNETKHENINIFTTACEAGLCYRNRNINLSSLSFLFFAFDKWTQLTKKNFSVYEGSGRDHYHATVCFEFLNSERRASCWLKRWKQCCDRGNEWILFELEETRKSHAAFCLSSKPFPSSNIKQHYTNK